MNILIVIINLVFFTGAFSILFADQTRKGVLGLWMLAICVGMNLHLLGEVCRFP